MNKETSAIERVNTWIKKSVTLKLVTITILMLLLLVPLGMIKSIIHEREIIRSQTVLEVSSKWAGDQLINGPVLTIPAVYLHETDEKTTEIIKNIYILPEELKINGNIVPEKLKRGIYEIIVYQSSLNFNGKFSLDKQVEKDNLSRILYDKAFLTIGISDLIGIKDKVKFNWDNTSLDVEPGSRIKDLVKSGITIYLPDLSPEIDSEIPFSLELVLQGSKNLSFTPLGKMTEVKVNSTWPSPSFVGNIIPTDRLVETDGFNAYWQVTQLNRNYPQYWVGNQFSNDIINSAFGVDLFNSIDDYQKTMRSAKYAVMCIALTFLIFFLVEVLNKRKIHPFQYALVGLALSIFYILLISISEHTNFNLAYLISGIAIISMITLYSLTIFKKIKLTFLLLFTLFLTYSFMFVTLQLEDYALLMGSVGLTVILAATMFYTRKINWYRVDIESE